MFRAFWNTRVLTVGLVLIGFLCLEAIGASPSAVDSRKVIDRYCVTCHNKVLKTGGLTLDLIDVDNIKEGAEVWEKVVQKLRTGTMPPPNIPAPPIEERKALLTWLETSLDKAAVSDPNPGRTETLRRLNRTEYQNSIRDLLSLNIEASSYLPPDESGHGFDNVIVGDLSPALLDRYISAAEKISRLAVGSTHKGLQSEIIRVSQDITQERHVPGLPIGTRGGVSIPFTFSQTGEYDIQIRLARSSRGFVGGLKGDALHTLELLLDRNRVKTFTVKAPPKGDDQLLADAHLKTRIPVTAGQHNLAATFRKNSSSLIETERQPGQSRFNEIRHPRLTPAIYEISIVGPYGAQGADKTPSRERIFVCKPTERSEEEECAREILSKLMRRAYRRSISEADLEKPMAFFREERSEGDFDAGIGKALSSILMNPSFLFRVERDPDQIVPGTSYQISDVELASRLSFFLWSSIPDEELLDSAIRGELRKPGELERQARRMLADPRSFNLATNFTGQWLRLRNLNAFVPNTRLYPDFDDNLRQAFRQETELFVDSILREDQSVLNLLKADYTFLNERLAKHYGIPNIYGTRFRRVSLGEKSKRGGLLRHGSVLAVTSYATRTSPVIRGVWVLDNIIGSPPPPPLPNVPALDENSVAASLPIRERLAEHRSNPVCSSCHATIDPVGFALENFDSVGNWRDDDGDNGAIDVSGGLPGVGEFNGVEGLEEGLLSRPELFAGTMTKKLLTFALGRGVEHYDGPAIRKILREAHPDGYRFSSLILGIIKSVPFQMRKST